MFSNSCLKTESNRVTVGLMCRLVVIHGDKLSQVVRRSVCRTLADSVTVFVGSGEKSGTVGDKTRVNTGSLVLDL